VGLFASYSTKKTAAGNTTVTCVSAHRLIMDYIEYALQLSISSKGSTSSEAEKWEKVQTNNQFAPLHSLFKKKKFS
jgi:hypothetical protein